MFFPHEEHEEPFDFTMQGPYKWRHASLNPLREFLVMEKQEYRFVPIMSVGLEVD